jgi:hypothetical protein
MAAGLAIQHHHRLTGRNVIVVLQDLTPSVTRLSGFSAMSDGFWTGLQFDHDAALAKRDYGDSREDQGVCAC